GGLRIRMQPYPPTAKLLARELKRAIVVPASRMSTGVVTMHSNVTYRDEMTGRARHVTLVYPGEELDGPDRLSVFTPIGAALIGLAEGETIQWLTAANGWRRLTVLAVHRHRPRQPAESVQ